MQYQKLSEGRYQNIPGQSQFHGGRAMDHPLSVTPFLVCHLNSAPRVFHSEFFRVSGFSVFFHEYLFAVFSLMCISNPDKKKCLS